MCTLHDFTCILLFVSVKDVELTVADVEAKGISVNLPVIFYLRAFKKKTHLK